MIILKQNSTLYLDRAVYAIFPETLLFINDRTENAPDWKVNPSARSSSFRDGGLTLWFPACRRVLSYALYRSGDLNK